MCKTKKRKLKKISCGVQLGEDEGGDSWGKKAVPGDRAWSVNLAGQSKGAHTHEPLSLDNQEELKIDFGAADQGQEWKPLWKES